MAISVYLVWSEGNFNSNIDSLRFSKFISAFQLKHPLPQLEIKEMASQKYCTPLLDVKPYRKTIEYVLVFIKTRVDKSFYNEAMEHLLNGVQYREIPTEKELSYSAHYTKQQIYLYPSLFDYGCTEDIASTIIHEMVHAVQHARYQQAGHQAGEHSLKGQNMDKVIAELEADGYQLYVSEKLELLSSRHKSKIANLINTRRHRYNEFKDISQ